MELTKKQKELARRFGVKVSEVIYDLIEFGYNEGVKDTKKKYKIKRRKDK